jgi:hypothetical protein
MLVTLEDLEPRKFVRRVITGMEEQDLLTYALIGAEVDAIVRKDETGSRSGS